MNAQHASNDNGATPIFERWVVALNAIGTTWIFLLMIIINADVFARYLFNAPINGVAEFVALSIVGIVFLQISDAIRAGRLTRSDGFLNRISAKRPRVGLVLNTIHDICGIAFFVAILIGGIPYFVEAYQGDYYVGTEGIFTVPVWPVKLILVISCITATAVFAVHIWRRTKTLMDKGVEE